MALKPYGNKQTEITWVTLGGTNKKTKAVNPTKAEGYYLGVQKSPDPWNPGQEKVTIILQKPDGTRVGVNTSTALRQQIERGTAAFKKENDVEALGFWAQIEFLGEEVSSKGNTYKNFSLQFDDERRIEPNDAPLVEDEAEEYNEVPDVKGFDAVIAASSNKKADVRSMLSRNKKV